MCGIFTLYLRKKKYKARICQKLIVHFWHFNKIINFWVLRILNIVLYRGHGVRRIFWFGVEKIYFFLISVEVEKVMFL